MDENFLWQLFRFGTKSCDHDVMMTKIPMVNQDTNSSSGVIYCDSYTTYPSSFSGSACQRPALSLSLLPLLMPPSFSLFSIPLFHFLDSFAWAIMTTRRDSDSNHFDPGLSYFSFLLESLFLAVRLCLSSLPSAQFVTFNSYFMFVEIFFVRKFRWKIGINKLSNFASNRLNIFSSICWNWDVVVN